MHALAALLSRLGQPYEHRPVKVEWHLLSAREAMVQLMASLLAAEASRVRFQGSPIGFLSF